MILIIAVLWQGAYIHIYRDRIFHAQNQSFKNKNKKVLTTAWARQFKKKKSNDKSKRNEIKWGLA